MSSYPTLPRTPLSECCVVTEYYVAPAVDADEVMELLNRLSRLGFTTESEQNRIEDDGYQTQTWRVTATRDQCACGTTVTVS